MRCDEHAGRTGTYLSRIEEPLLHAGVRASLADESDMEVIDADPTSVHRSVDVVVADSSTAARIAEDSRRLKLAQSLQFDCSGQPFATAWLRSSLPEPHCA